MEQKHQKHDEQHNQDHGQKIKEQTHALLAPCLNHGVGVTIRQRSNTGLRSLAQGLIQTGLHEQLRVTQNRLHRLGGDLVARQ